MLKFRLSTFRNCLLLDIKHLVEALVSILLHFRISALSFVVSTLSARKRLRITFSCLLTLTLAIEAQEDMNQQNHTIVHRYFISFHFIFNYLYMVAPQIQRSGFQGAMLKN